METLLTAASIIVFCALAALAIWQVRSVAKRGLRSARCVVIVHCALACYPLAFDWVNGRPAHEYYPGFRAASEETFVTLIYLLYMLVTPCILLSLERPYHHLNYRGRQTWHDLSKDMVAFRPLFYIIAAGPILYAVILPDRAAFTTYALAATSILDSDTAGQFKVLYPLTYFALLACVILLLTSKRLKTTLLAVLPFIAAAAWLNGKRNIVALAAILVLGSLRVTKRLTDLRFGILLALCIPPYFVYSSWYQQSFRPSLELTGTTLEARRADLSRDADIKLAIYAEFHQDEFPILQYRGQSLLFNFLFFVPREVWPDKPRPYFYYVTARALMIPYTFMNWGVETSWLGEAIANLSWPGLLIGPLLLAWLCRLGDSFQRASITMATSVVGGLFLFIDFPGFLPIWVIMTSMMIREAVKGFRRRTLHRVAAPYSPPHSDVRTEKTYGGPRLYGYKLHNMPSRLVGRSAAPPPISSAHNSGPPTRAV